MESIRLCAAHNSRWPEVDPRSIAISWRGRLKLAIPRRLMSVATARFIEGTSPSSVDSLFESPLQTHTFTIWWSKTAECESSREMLPEQAIRQLYLGAYRQNRIGTQTILGWKTHDGPASQNFSCRQPAAPLLYYQWSCRTAAYSAYGIPSLLLMTTSHKQ